MSSPLAVEIQIEIVLTALSNGVSPTTLMLVCGTWKYIVYERMHSAQIADNISEDIAERVIAHFQKARFHPIFLCLPGLDFGFRVQEWTYIRDFSTTFFPRVTSLGLRGNWDIIRELVANFGSTLPLLEELSIYFKLLGTVTPHLELTTFSRLRVLRLAGDWSDPLSIQSAPITFPATNIRHLELGSETLNVYVARAILSSCIQVQTCVLHIGFRGQNPPTSRSSFVSPVEDLHISGYGDTSEILTDAQFPKLQLLTIHEAFHAEDPNDRSALAVLDGSALPVLASLSTTVASYDADFLHLLRRLPTLVSLELSLMGGLLINKAVSVLAGTNMLPSLRDLCVISRCKGQPCEELEEQVLSLISSRQRGLQRAFFSAQEVEIKWETGMDHPHVRTLCYPCTIAPLWAFDLWPRRTLYNNSTVAVMFDADFAVPFSLDRHPVVAYY
ncbi:hypothetical protein BDN72DRAFT_907013 [Pluteus cervinus]|uniref:Uncharacterized protein n=1 Tax=Pluteus cervinus TaxID=181527 RepID=A0ACD2ZXN6_9AGAR|nr:hypothetical protein BDN72DRAFT_907013 [Pluteus cervinus]